MTTEPFGAGGAIPRPLFCARRRHSRHLVYGLAAVVLAGAWSPASAGPLDGLRRIIGQASWYGSEFASRRTASGNRFDPAALTGAHRTLPLGMKVLVTNLRNGRSVLVTITDRGPFLRQREIDLSYGAARVLGMLQQGVARVSIEPAAS